MKALFDLREKQNDEIYEDIGKLYDEPLKVVRLGQQSITACIGCWNCWLKTPGRCVLIFNFSLFKVPLCLFSVKAFCCSKYLYAHQIISLRNDFLDPTH